MQYWIGSASDALVIPGEVDGLAVIGIGDEALRNCGMGIAYAYGE